MSIAICSRVLQFRAGPNETRFYACAEHRATLEAGDVDLFFPTDDEPLRDEDGLTEDDEPCWFCREG